MRNRYPAALLLLATLALTACDDPTGPDADDFLDCSVTAISVGAEVTGSLSNSDCQLGTSEGEYVDYYGFTLTSDRTVTIDMTSNVVDTYLLLFDRETDSLVAQNDDGGSSFNARLTQSLSAGSYVIGATSFFDGEVGTYELAIN